MTIHLPDELASSLRAAVLNGHFASEEELVAAAVRDYLLRKHDEASQTASTSGAALEGKAIEEPSGQELQRKLLDAGIVTEIKPPITDPRPYLNRKAVPIKGQPLSETVIRERR